MDERPCFRVRREIIDFPVEENIRCEQANRDYAPAEINEFAREQPSPRKRQACDYDEIECRQYPPYAALIKIDYRKAATGHFGVYIACDEIAADHEKHIHADEAAAENLKARVIEDDGNDRQRAEPIDLASVRGSGSRAIDPWRGPREAMAHVGEGLFNHSRRCVRYIMGTW